MSFKKLEPVVLAIAIALPTLVTWVYFVALTDCAATVQQTAYGVGKAIQFGLPIAWMFLCYRKGERSFRTWQNVGLEGLRQPQEIDVAAARRMGVGVGVGFGVFVALSIFLGFYWILTPLGLADVLAVKVGEKVAGLAIDSALKFALLGTFYALVHSFMEEYYWRWFVFNRLRRYVRLWPAILISSFGFMAHHVILMATFLGWESPLTYLISATVAIGGMTWAWLYQRSGKLIWSWVSHMIVDAAIFALGYVLVFGTG